MDSLTEHETRLPFTSVNPICHKIYGKNNIADCGEQNSGNKKNDLLLPVITEILADHFIKFRRIFAWKMVGLFPMFLIFFLSRLDLLIPLVQVFSLFQVFNTYKLHGKHGKII